MIETAETTNYGRTAAYRAFCETLDELFEKPDVSEASFRDAWLRRLQLDERLYLDGWYCPPPHGMSVLFATDSNPARISFETLRNEVSWPSSQAIEWARGLLFAYCSPVDISTGRMGDFAIWLYFGSDAALRAHFRRCHAATQEVLAAALEPGQKANDLFARSEDIFTRHRLKNSVFSSTDSVPLDLGHTFPALAGRPTTSRRELTPDERKELSTGRQFVSSAHDWELDSSPEFTVEPQLLSLDDPALPQITFHYLVRRYEHASIAGECDELFRRFGLI